MSCSACRIDVLRSFLYAFGVQHVKSLPVNSPKTIQRRAINSGTILRLSATSVKSSAPRVQDGTPLAGFDHSYIPFAPSSASASATQSTFSVPVPPERRWPIVTEISDRKLGEHDFLPDSDVYEPDITLRIESKTRQLVRDGTKGKTSPSGRRVTGAHERRTHRQDGRSYSGRRVPTSISETEEKVGRFTAEKATAKKMTPNPQEPWGVQKTALEQKFGDQGWAPRKRLSPDALDGIRALHAQYPEKYSTAVLAEQFKVSPEAIRRILKSKWRPNDEEDVSRRQRWQKRGEAIWGQMVELGVKPPKKWRNMGIGRINHPDPEKGSEREKPRARLRNVNRGEVAQEDLVKAPKAIAQADELVRRSLSDRIL
ncbi:Required for respiratory growth protein 9 mitochondrial [Xylographa bjoerkii]|nr:Required for respiratory growth protein 9 mitochondrial [Xylographa bjoerkii]